LESDEHRKSPPPSDYDLEDVLEINSNIVKIEMTQKIEKSKIDKSNTSLSTDSMEENNMSVKGSSFLPSDTLENNSKVNNDKENTNGKLETKEHRKIPATSQNDKAAHYDIIEDKDETLEVEKSLKNSGQDFMQTNTWASNTWGICKEDLVVLLATLMSG